MLDDGRENICSSSALFQNCIYRSVPLEILKQVFNGVLNRYVGQRQGELLSPLSCILFIKNANLIFAPDFTFFVWFCSLYRQCRSRKK